MCLEWESNPQPLGPQDDAPSDCATCPGLAFQLFFIAKYYFIVWMYHIFVYLLFMEPF